MPSEAVDVDHGQLVYASLKDCPVVVDLHELSPVGRRATGRRDGRWFERFAEMRQDLPDRPRIGNEPDYSDVATTPRALQRKLLPHPRHEFRPRNPGGVVGRRFVAYVAAVGGGISARRMSADRMPTSRGITRLADIPFCHAP